MKIRIRSVDVELADLVRYVEAMADMLLNYEFDADCHQILVDATFEGVFGLGLDPADFPHPEDTDASE